MELVERVGKLEQLALDGRDRLAKIEARLDTFPELFATKADLHREINTQTWKLVSFVCGFGTALVAATYFVVTHVR
ncbi:MAG: hypothetical protein JWQ01_1110 [Massilia sp.]|jgi:hypothetical protein|nr:hypothetical protein [Massilia sp.]